MTRVTEVAAPNKESERSRVFMCDFASFYYFSIEFMNFSDSVVF